jgi:hypothetical protein
MNQQSTMGSSLLLFEEVLRDASPESVIQRLQDIFVAIQNMAPNELLVAAQTIRTIAALDTRFKRHPGMLSIANAVREAMVYHADGLTSLKYHSAATTYRGRYAQVWGAKRGWFSYDWRSIQNAIIEL